MTSLFFLVSMFPFVSEVVKAIEDVVADMSKINSLTGNEKRREIVDATRKALDELDNIPGWSTLGEDARDRILDGLVEIAYRAFCHGKSSTVPTGRADVEAAMALVKDHVASLAKN